MGTLYRRGRGHRRLNKWYGSYTDEHGKRRYAALAQVPQRLDKFRWGGDFGGLFLMQVVLYRWFLTVFLLNGRVVERGSVNRG